MEWKTIPNAHDYEMSEAGTIRRTKDQRPVEVGMLAQLWCRGRQEWKDVRKLYAATFGREMPSPQQANVDAVQTRNHRL